MESTIWNVGELRPKELPDTAKTDQITMVTGPKKMGGGHNNG